MSYDTHKHRCPKCQWNWVCTCSEPDQHHGFCFDCDPNPPAPLPVHQSVLVSERWDLRDEAP